MVKITGLLDYSVHELEIKKLMRDIDALLKKKQFIEAASLLDEVVVEARLMRTAVKSHVGDKP